MKVYIGCFGSGLGHAARMLEIAKELDRKGAKLEFSSSGEAASLIAKRGYACNRLPLADVSYSEDGEFQVKETLLDTPSILTKTNEQLVSELANIGRFAPDAVLSDSALSTAMAGKILRIPTFTVLNQLNLTSSHGQKNAFSRLFSVGMTTGMGKLWELTDYVFLPDLPPPYTISEKNLWGSGVENARYVGFLFSQEKNVPDEAAKEFAADRRPKVFWQVSGPPRTRKSFLEKALKYSASMSDEFAFVITAGDPSGATAAGRLGDSWYYGWCDIADVYFRSCDVVVSRAGHGTIAQSIMSSKPMLIVPIPKQPEQEGNADKAAQLGVSITMRQGELSEESVRGSLRSLLRDGHRAKADELGKVAQRYDARSTIVAALEDSARRGRRGRR